MKRLRQLFAILIILPIISMCFVGCSKQKEITLTNENIKDYIVFNYTFERENPSSSSYILEVETTQRKKNTEFKNCEFTFTHNNKSKKVVVDFEGKSKFAFTFSPDDLIYNEDFEFTITEVIGTVIQSN